MVGGIEMKEHSNLGREVIGHDDKSWVIDHLPSFVNSSGKYMKTPLEERMWEIR